MDNKEIKMKFIYDQVSYLLKCMPNQTIEEVCREFFPENGIDFNSVYFVFNGNVLAQANYEKLVNEFVSPLSEGELGILVFKSLNEYLPDKNV